MSGQTQDRHENLRGTVKAVNFAPKGEVDGMILDVGGGVVQVNVPPDQAGHVAGLVGKDIEVTVGPEPKVAEHPKGGHPVHKLVAFGGENQHGQAAGHKPHPPGHKPHPPGHAEPAEVSGKVARLNYAKHGEANGVVLDSGDFIHLKPDGMKKAGLQVGHEVTAKGKATPTQAGAKAVEAEIINGVGLDAKKPD